MGGETGRQQDRQVQREYFKAESSCYFEKLRRSWAKTELWLQVKEELLEQKEAETESQDVFEVEDDDIELQSEEEAEEWTGFSEPSPDNSATEGTTVQSTLPPEMDEPVASTSKSAVPSSSLLDTSEYEQPFDG